MFNVALFGAGRIGQIHARNAAAGSELNLKYIVDPNQGAAAALANLTGATVVDADAAFGDGAISGVIIASATNAHLDHGVAGTSRGQTIFARSRWIWSSSARAARPRSFRKPRC